MALDPVYSVRVAATVFQTMGLVLTAMRIWFRLKIGRFWWEDAWAAISLLCGLLWVIAEWVFLSTNGLASIITSWIYSIGFTCTIVAVRMSILLSIARIVQRTPFLRRLTFICAGFFAACWVILIAEKVYECGSDPNWHHVMVSSGKPFCLVKAPVSIFQFTTDCISIAILVALPLRMLWKVKLPPRQRRMILSVFASSIIMALGALFHTLGQVLNVYVVMIAGINVEVALSLFVCNLLVTVTCTYRFLQDGGVSASTDSSESEDSYALDDDFTRPTPLPRSTGQYLTTVELDLSGQYTGGCSQSVPTSQEIA
ncbi:hypothetical protein HYDPIDRAFT_108134 [Hydnomerulius pinastri MD-312]|nr:hypothetical protein HYDPIDRAFT_108134 [Hydnomerulius pinastri MD-312]